MEKTEKILTILGTICLAIVVIFIIIFAIAFKEMLNDYRCNQLPLNEFFQDKQCERYWKEK